MTSIDASEAGDALAEVVLAASARLSAALIEGRGITEARAGLADARCVFEAHQTAAAAQRDRADAEREAAIATTAVAHVREAAERLRAATALPATNIGDEFAMPSTIILDPANKAALAAAADRLARAEHAWNGAAEDARAAQEAESRISHRIADLDAQRAAIGQRRAAGHAKAADGGELETIALDKENLMALLGDAAAKTVATREIVDERTRIAAMARDAMATVEAGARRDHFAAQAATLGDALLQTIEAMNSAAKAVGDRSPPWKPAPALQTLLLQLAHGVLR